MKHLKILGLAVLAATALMALAGVGSAAATETTLCKVKETVGGLPQCAAANQYLAGTVVHAELETAWFLLETPVGNIECEESTIEAKTEKQTAIPLGANVTAFTFGKCFGDTIQTIKLGTLDIEVVDLPEWTHNGTLTFTGTEVTVEKFGFHCIYSPGDTGTLTGGAMATIDLLGTWTRIGGRSGALCGSKANAAGFYTVKKPEPLWISM